MTTSDPFEYLNQTEARFVKSAVGLPQDVQLKEYWTGIGFRLGDYSYVAPLGEVVEILTYPESITPIHLALFNFSYCFTRVTVHAIYITPGLLGTI